MSRAIPGWIAASSSRLSSALPLSATWVWSRAGASDMEGKIAVVSSAAAEDGRQREQDRQAAERRRQPDPESHPEELPGGDVHLETVHRRHPEQARERSGEKERGAGIDAVEDGPEGAARAIPV